MFPQLSAEQQVRVVDEVLKFAGKPASKQSGRESVSVATV
jgi:hypothetical protein